MSKRLLYIIPSLNSGGVEKDVIESSNYFINRGFEIFIMTTEAKLKNLLDSRIKIIIHNVRTKNAILLIKNIFFIRHFCKKYKIDILHPKSRAPAISSWFAIKKTKTKLVTTMHGLHNLNNRWSRWYSSFITRGEELIVVSDTVYSYLVNNYTHINKNKISIIKHGIDVNKYDIKNITQGRIREMAKKLELDVNPNRVLFFPSRLGFYKGHLFLLEGLKNLKRRDFKCIIACDSKKNSQMRKALFNKIDEYELNLSIKVVDYLQDIQSVMYLSHAIISLSLKTEAFGKVIIESGAMSRPVIGTNLGPYRINIVDKKSGWVVEPNSIENLTNVLEEVLSISNDEWFKMCIFARKYIEKNFQINEMFHKIENIYEKILS